MSDLTQFFEDDIIKEIRDEFLEDLIVKIGYIDKYINDLKKNGYDEPVIKETFRLLHNIKGSSSTVGLDEIGKISHKMEDEITLMLNKSTTKVNDKITNRLFLLLDILDQIRELFTKNNSPEKILQFYENSLESLKTEKISVLIIEFSDSIRKFLKKMLRKQGYYIKDFKNIERSISSIFFEPLDVLITSLEHPVIDGIDLIKMLKIPDNKSNIKTILLTSSKIESTFPDLIIQKNDSMANEIISFIETLK